MQVFRWSGVFTDGRTATLREVGVVYDGHSLLIRDSDGSEISRWPASRIITEPGTEPGALHLRCSMDPQAGLELRGENLVLELHAIGIKTRGRPAGSGRRAIVAASLIAGIVGAVGLVWSSVTPLSRAIATLVPLEFERALSGQVEEAFSELHCEGDDARLVLEELVLRVAGPDHALPPVHVLNLERPNAFALPGGGIVFTRGLLTKARHPDEVAGILAHEIQHVRQRHVMTAMIRGTLLTALWAVTVGDYSGLLVVDPSTVFQIATLQFSRDDEANADRGAVEMLDAAKIRRDGLSDFFTRLAAEEGQGPEWLSTHPPAEGRAKASQANGQIEPGDLTSSLDDSRWQILVEACEQAGDPEADLEDLVF